ncbi:MAG TPA: hypothetical protein VM098_05100, partial [Phycisphaerae bacterium]|nr:hypothetical protein [Phycisphaerae bacterium]
ALIKRKDGKGTAVFLNFRLPSPHLNQFQPDTPEWERYKARRANVAHLVGRLLAGAVGEQKNYSVCALAADESPLPYTMCYAFRQDGLRLFGVLQQTHLNRPDRTNADKSSERYYLRGAAEYDPKPATLFFPEKGEIYDLRAKKYLGSADRASVQITPGRAELYAVLDYRVGRLAIDAPDAVEAGQPFRFSAASATSGAPGTHVLRVEWADPDGRKAEHYSQNIAGRGTAAGWMQFALNDTPGKWTLTATDVITGTTASKTVKVKARKLDELERLVPRRPEYVVEHVPFRFHPLKGAANPGNVMPAKPAEPDAAEREQPLLSLGEPFIEQKGCFVYFPGQPYHQVVQGWEAVFRPGPLEYKLRWMGHRGGCDYTKTVKPSEDPVLDSSLGIESPTQENWLSWNKLGFINIALDGEDLKTAYCKPAKAGESAIDLAWETAKGTVSLRLAAVKGTEELLARLTVKAKEAIQAPVVTLHNRAGGVSPVGEFWHVITARRDDALGSDLSLPDECWAVFADRAMNRAQSRGAGVSALVILPDPEQIRQVHVEKAGSKVEPTATDTRHNRYSHMMNTTITLAPIAAGGTRTLRFALWERPDRSNDDARKYMIEKAGEIVKRMRNEE